MIHCAKCSYAWNPDTARLCVQCKAPLESSGQSHRGDTFNEELQQPVRRQTIVEGAAPIPKSANAGVANQQRGDPTPRQPIPPKRTAFAGFSQDAPASSGPRQPINPSRKIVGVLITYSWQEQGQIFPILEGRNLIGKDPTQCDICIPEDATLSAVNSFITHRRQFIIGDKVSMSGTDVDGEPVEAEFVPLRNYAKIRTGSTYWTFVCIQPPPQSADPAS